MFFKNIYRPWTYGFCHENLIHHFLTNMGALLIFGGIIEFVFKSRFLISVIAMCLPFGAVFGALLDPTKLHGLSAVTYGTLFITIYIIIHFIIYVLFVFNRRISGCLVDKSPGEKDLLNHRISQVITWMLVIIIIFSDMGDHVSWSAHLGGSVGILFVCNLFSTSFYSKRIKLTYLSIRNLNCLKKLFEELDRTADNYNR